MATTATDTPLAASTAVLARIPYLNCAPFFHGWQLEAGWQWLDAAPRQLGQAAAEGHVLAATLALADFLRLRERYERLGNLGIAVRGRCRSITLFSKRPIRQLDGVPIAVTEETSTSVLLLRLILEQRYRIRPGAYRRGADPDAEARLVIGDEALRLRASNRQFPYEIDLAFEWWLWQHLPAVFAVWAVRKDATPAQKQQLLRVLHRQLAVNLPRAEELAAARAEALGACVADLKAYLESFVYRFGAAEEAAVARFADLVDAHHLL